MNSLDYSVLSLYILGTLGLGVFFYFRNKTSEDMFSAAGQSPWWVSGLSGFMTIFSAATFVVWGGIAYQYGVVALSINMCYGVASLAVGYFVAGRWKKTGVHTPSEYIELRFGKTVMHFYIWILMLFRIISAAVALYGLSILLAALMPMSADSMFHDPDTGNISVSWAITLFGLIVVIYTMAGGLWAVLMTDVIQFIVLTLSVIFVVPLMLTEVGGFQAFVNNAPDGFFDLVAGDFTWLFLLGWTFVNFFLIGADWAFAQRFISVPSEKDARKSAYLFGILYLVSPFMWLAPPMLYRVIDSSANPEQAYILASKLVLPAGMLGMMVAAMFSATASMVSSQLNVFAGGLTDSIYHGRLRPHAKEKELLWAGRGFSLLLGVALIGIANLIPYIGAATLVIAKSSLIIGPMLAPPIWGLYSRTISVSAIWMVALFSTIAAITLKSAMMQGGFLAQIGYLSGLAEWAQNSGKIANMVIGVVVPIVVLVVMETKTRVDDSGWLRVQATAAERLAQASPQKFDSSPAWIVVIAISIISLMVFVVALVSTENIASLLSFSGATLAIAAVIGCFTFKASAHHARKGQPDAGIDLVS